MPAVTEHYRTAPLLTIWGGMDFDYALECWEADATELDGKLTSLVNRTRRDFTGWTSFVGQLRSDDGQYAETCSIGVDGPADEGVLYIRGVAAQTWRLQQAGVRAGNLTIYASAPTGQRLIVAPCRFRLRESATNPNTPSIPDWTVLR